MSARPADGTLVFLPHRLNRHPVVVRGLTADELWLCCAVSAAAGFALGLPLAWLAHSIAVVPTSIVACTVLGIFVVGGCLRTRKRGRPDTWLYRQLQWRLTCAHPMLADWVGGHLLITRSGGWSVGRRAP